LLLVIGDNDPRARETDSGPRSRIKGGVVLLKELRGCRQGPEQSLGLPELAVDHERQCPGGFLEVLLDLMPVMAVSGIDGDPGCRESWDQQDKREKDQARAQG